MKSICKFWFVAAKCMVILVILICGCKKKDEISIGSFFGGGIIFYIDNTGQHGLLAAPDDQGYSAWGCTLTEIAGAEGSTVGTGYQNTLDILNSCSETDAAAYICANLELNGYADWFLPSIGELNLMYNNLKKNNIGNFKSTIKILWYESDAIYWSSTESAPLNPEDEFMYAWSQNFKTGIQSSGNSKNNGGYIRPIRAF